MAPGVRICPHTSTFREFSKRGKVDRYSNSWRTHDGAQDLAIRVSPPEALFTFLDYRFLGVGLAPVGTPDPPEIAVCQVEYPYGVVRQDSVLCDEGRGRW